eukprot:m.256739 g.256739  ORF g.256739 m.256739 type:complete len:95 (+) comp34658_c0_seq1:281-565(+)
MQSTIHRMRPTVSTTFDDKLTRMQWPHRCKSTMTIVAATDANNAVVPTTWVPTDDADKTVTLMMWDLTDDDYKLQRWSVAGNCRGATQQRTKVN